MSHDLFRQFSAYEDELLARYEQHPLFKNIQSLDNDKFLHVLTQYGEGISANFVKFVETALRQVGNVKAQEAMINILRDEILQSGPTHQQMRGMSMARIGVSAHQLVATELTPATHNTVKRYFEIITHHPWKNRDLGITSFVRVVGESLVGVVYRVFTKEIMRRFNVPENEIEFYSFHWHHDEKGGTGDHGEIGHTEYYDLAMQDLLKTEADLQEAKKAADMALELREEFQNQFI